MNRKKLVSIVILGALATASVFGAIAYRTANAQTATPAAPSTSGAVPQGKVPRGGPGGYGNAAQDQRLMLANTDLATALGITTDQLNTAYQTATSAALKQAVEQGLITQAQADQMTANGQAFPFDGHGGGFLSQSGIDFDAELATALGITVEKLQAAYLQAFNARIDAAVAAGTMTQAQADLEKGEYALSNSQSFQTSMQTAYQSAVSQAVTDGVITQAQADAILKNNPSFGMGGFKGMDGPHGMGGFDGGGGRPGGGPGGPGGGVPPSNAPANPNTTVAPTVTP